MRFLILVSALVFGAFAIAQVGPLGRVQEQMIRQSEGVRKATDGLTRGLQTEMRLIEVIAARGELLNLDKKRVTEAIGDTSEVYLHLYYQSADGKFKCLVKRLLYDGNKAGYIGSYGKAAICRHDQGSPFTEELP